jgi:hypothetical protein
MIERLATKGAIWACVALAVLCAVLSVVLWLQQAALKACETAAR